MYKRQAQEAVGRRLAAAFEQGVGASLSATAHAPAPGYGLGDLIASVPAPLSNLRAARTADRKLIVARNTVLGPSGNFEHVADGVGSGGAAMPAGTAQQGLLLKHL